MRNLNDKRVTVSHLHSRPVLRFLQRLFSFSRRSVGEQGEHAAAEWLRKERRFSIVTRNWRSPHDRRDEIDLVCRDGEALVFVEVKTRAANALVPGFYAVDRRKKRVLQRAIRTYLRQLHDRPKTFRCDVVEVVLPAAQSAAGGARARTVPEVRHFENVTLFTKFFQP
jgi:putative endonuclease